MRFLTIMLFSLCCINLYSQDIEKDKFVFQYRINTIDTNWRNIEQFEAEKLSQLPGGSYEIEIRKVDRSSGEITYLTRIPTQVPVYFWERISFWWLHIIVFILLFWLIRKYEIKYRYISKKSLLEKRKVVENERTRIARDFHDSVGSSLAQCSILVEVAKEKIQKGDIEKIDSDLTQIIKTLKNLDEQLREIIWSLDPSNSGFQDMVIFFRNYAANFLNTKNIKLELKVIGQTKDLKFTSEFRRNVFFILKEALTNICKHSIATKVDINMNISANNFIMNIKDNGVGFDQTLKTTDPKTGKGLNNISARAAALGGSTNVKSQPGQGTEIIVNIPDLDLYLV